MLFNLKNKLKKAQVLELVWVKKKKEKHWNTSTKYVQIKFISDVSDGWMDGWMFAFAFLHEIYQHLPMGWIHQPSFWPHVNVRDVLLHHHHL